MYTCDVHGKLEVPEFLNLDFLIFERFVASIYDWPQGTLFFEKVRIRECLNNMPAGYIEEILEEERLAYPRLQ
jgi:hypothetical protein